MRKTIEFQWLMGNQRFRELTNYRNRCYTLLKRLKTQHLNYYVTLTLDPKKKDSKNINSFFEGIRKLFKRYKVDYYLVPELHQSGAYHFHGFLYISYNNLKYLVDKNRIDNFGNNLYGFIPYERNYGFTSIVEIDDYESIKTKKMVKYTIKYVLKSGFNARYSNSNFYKEYVNDFMDELISLYAG